MGPPPRLPVGTRTPSRSSSSSSTLPTAPTRASAAPMGATLPTSPVADRHTARSEASQTWLLVSHTYAHTCRLFSNRIGITKSIMALSSQQSHFTNIRMAPNSGAERAPAAALRSTCDVFSTIDHSGAKREGIARKAIGFRESANIGDISGVLLSISRHHHHHTTVVSGHLGTGGWQNHGFLNWPVAAHYLLFCLGVMRRLRIMTYTHSF